MVKPQTKVKIQPGSSVLWEQSEDIRQFHANKVFGQIFQLVKNSPDAMWRYCNEKGKWDNHVTLNFAKICSLSHNFLLWKYLVYNCKINWRQKLVPVRQLHQLVSKASSLNYNLCLSTLFYISLTWNLSFWFQKKMLLTVCTLIKLTIRSTILNTVF